MATKQDKREASKGRVKFRAKYAIRKDGEAGFGKGQMGNFSISVAVFNTPEKVAGAIEVIAAETHGVEAKNVVCLTHRNVVTDDRYAIDGGTLRSRTAEAKPKTQHAKPTAEQIAGFTKDDIVDAVSIFELDESLFDLDAEVETLQATLVTELGVE